MSQPREYTAEELRAIERDTWSEKTFTAKVIALAQSHGWKAAHFRPAQTKAGNWITAVQGDGKGFPDLILIRGDELYAIELKVGGNKPTTEQIVWLDLFDDVEGKVYSGVWWPEDWSEIERVLTTNRKALDSREE